MFQVFVYSRLLREEGWGGGRGEGRPPLDMTLGIQMEINEYDVGCQCVVRCGAVQSSAA